MSNEEAEETAPDPSRVGGSGPDVRLEALKVQLWGDFGKTTCWKWLCQERGAMTVTEQIAIAEEVLAMPRMGNVAAAQTFWLRLQGNKSFNVDELIAKKGS